jgi:hypothetical protein
MEPMHENKFSIRRIIKAGDDDYIKALQIYNRTTPYEIKTDTNEISLWLSKNEGNSHFEVMIFVLYIDSTIIGMAVMSYIKNMKIMIIEYLAVGDQYRKNVVLFSFMSLLNNYFDQTNKDISYFLVEISNKGDGKNIDKESRIFKKLVCLEGFGKINETYYTLPIGVRNNESSFQAFLYIKTNDDIKTISKETFMSIVNAIYYEYSYAWYSESHLLNEPELFAYKQIIDSIYGKIQKNVKNKNSVSVRYMDCPVIDPVSNERTSGFLPVPKKKNIKMLIPFIIVLVMILPGVIILLYYYLLKMFNIELSSVNAILGSTFGAMMTSAIGLLAYKVKS